MILSRLNLNRKPHKMHEFNWREVAEEVKTIRRVTEVVLVFVTYNLSNRACSMLKYLANQKMLFNVIVVDNKSELPHFNELMAEANKHNNVRVIRSRYNLGSAGGYAIGLQAALEDGYEYYLLTEDDAVPENGDLVDKLIASRNKKARSVVRYINAKCNSYSYHFHLYPRELILSSGIPDEKLFQVHDDLEFAWRVYASEKKLGFKPEQLLSGCGYYHPIIKNSIARPFTLYLSCRNRLHISNLHRKGLNECLIECLGWSLFAWSHFIASTEPQAVRAFNCSVLDFVIQNVKVKTNIERVQQFAEKYSKIFALIESTEGGSKNLIETKNLQRDYIVCSKRLDGVFAGVENVSIIGLIWVWLGCKRVIATNLNSPYLPLILLSAKFILVKEIDCVTGDFVVVECQNKITFRRLKVTVALLLGLINVVLLAPLVTVRYICGSIRFPVKSGA
jgi:GT2 family glycosyltransferase